MLQDEPLGLPIEPFESRKDTITRILLREERLQLVVNELGHRTKNLLTVIQAIATQTARRSASLKAFQSEFSQRLGALSRSMDLLMEEGEPGVSVAELVQWQLQPFGDIDGQRISATGPVVLLNVEATQTLGLALHELATNATKYGAFSVAQGAVTLNWSIGPGKFGPSSFCLTWCERNGPPVSPPTHHGFGLIVLQRMTAGGDVSHDFDVGGARWTLEAPAETILHQAGT